jgi:SNF2 family DNA or RNA helicase
MQLIIDYDEPLSCLRVSGDVRGALRRPLVATYVRNCKGSVQTDDGTLVIPAGQTELDRRYQALRKILARAGITSSPSAQMAHSLTEVVHRDALFSSFSEKAAQIWTDHFASEEFKDYCEVVAQRCPATRLYRLQLLSSYHLAFSQNACNFSVPGAGKTRVVYAAYAYLSSLPALHPKHANGMLIVGPLSSFKAWEDEFEATFGRPARAKRLSGATNAAERAAFLSGFSSVDPDAFDLVLTSYQALSSGLNDFQGFLQRPTRKLMLVLDEAHNIKREDGVWAAAALRLAPFATARIVLTGTPVPNGYEDLENLFRFLYPERDIIGFHGSSLKAMSQGKMREAVPLLRDKLRPFFTRIRKSDLGLPPIRETHLEIPLGAEQAEIYRQIERAVIPRLEREVDQFSASLVQARLIRLRQAATNPGLLLAPLEETEFGAELAAVGGAPYGTSIGEAIRRFDPLRSLAKLSRLRRLIRELVPSQPKILVWSYFLGNLDLLEKNLTDLAKDVFRISGATPVGPESELPEDVDVATRERIIERFKCSPDSAILVANPQAIGESISLHKECHVAIYFDRDFNAGRFMQSKDRIHRYGLEAGTTTHYYYLTGADTVEQDINQRLALKEQRLLDLIEHDDIPLFRLALSEDEGRQDVRAIIESYERRKIS